MQPEPEPWKNELRDVLLGHVKDPYKDKINEYIEFFEIELNTPSQGW